ncbi:MAG: hypothetical protein D6E12_13665 [Desulfovibrio sp.]|nr:MAG: hypothetical protein D6E12_13665 [Desulfovibrio sp.]
MAEEQRLYGLDNCRSLMVLFIVLLHAACAYALIIPWWHARDANHQAYDLVMLLVDTFALPALYLVAGVFARPSYDKRGAQGFVLAKLKRLGIPVLLLSALYLPAMVYAGYLNRCAEPVSFFAYWGHWMGSFLDWKLVMLTDMEVAAPYVDTFSPHHLWFIVLLLVFFAGYALWRSLVPEQEEATQGNGSSRGLRLLLIGGAAMVLGFFLVRLCVQDWAWGRLGPLLLFQPTRIPIYLGMFVLGVLMQPRLASGRRMPGPSWLWLVLFLAGLGAFMALAQQSMAAMISGHAPLWLKVAQSLVRTWMALTGACFFVNLLLWWGNRPSAWRRSLAASSYDIYLLHMPLVVFVQAGLLSVAMPLALKFAVAFLVPVLACWGLSRFVLARGAWLGMALLAAFFLGYGLLYS